MSARNADTGSRRGYITTARHQVVSEISRPRRRDVGTTSTWTTKDTSARHALYAVSRPTTLVGQRPPRRPRQRPPRRPRQGQQCASTLSTGVTAVSTWTRSNNVDDTRPRTLSKRLTPLYAASCSGAPICVILCKVCQSLDIGVSCIVLFMFTAEDITLNTYDSPCRL